MLAHSVCGGHSPSLSQSGNWNRDSDKKLPFWEGENLFCDLMIDAAVAGQHNAYHWCSLVVPGVGFATIQKWDFQGESIFIKDETDSHIFSPPPPQASLFRKNAALQSQTQPERVVSCTLSRAPGYICPWASRSLELCTPQWIGPPQ